MDTGFRSTTVQNGDTGVKYGQRRRQSYKLYLLYLDSKLLLTTTVSDF